MSKKRKGRSGGGFVQVFNYMMESAAWKDLSVGARATYVELKKLYNGANNGRLGFGSRGAANVLGKSKSMANRYLKELGGPWLYRAPAGKFILSDSDDGGMVFDRGAERRNWRSAHPFFFAIGRTSKIKRQSHQWLDQSHQWDRKSKFQRVRPLIVPPVGLKRQMMTGNSPTSGTHLHLSQRGVRFLDGQCRR